MSRDPYGPVSGVSAGSRSPGRVGSRRLTELPTVDRSPSRGYPGGRGSPLGRKPSRQTRSGNSSPDHAGYGTYNHHSMGSPYYGREDDLGSPGLLDERGRPLGPGVGHHRSRSASRPALGHPMTVRYQSLDRAGMMGDPHDREFLPIREPRERSMERSTARDRSLERGLYLEEELYGAGSRSARQSPNPHGLLGGGRGEGGVFLGELQHQNNDLQRELLTLKKDLELTNQKLGSSMHSIKTFWSPELKKERALRKEESAKYSLINDQLKLLNNENQKQAMLVRQLEEELRLRMRAPSLELQQQIEVLFSENEHLQREIAILRDTIKELELRIETQKQTLQARDESIKKLLEMLQNKGMGKEEERQMFQQMQAMAQKQLDEFRVEIQRRDQEILGMAAKMKTLEEQHQDYQRHIAVLKESLCAKEEHYNMLQSDVEELRQRLEEKNRVIEKKTQAALQSAQERNRVTNELTELKDHMDIKDRKINVLQRKLDLHEANKKLQAFQQNPRPGGEDTAALKKQIEDERKKLDEQKRQIDEQKRNLEAKRKEIEDKEKQLIEFEKQLKKRKEQMDQLEASLRKAGGGAAAAGELNKKLTEAQKQLDVKNQQLEKTKEEAQHSAKETERLLQLVQMSQEEQNAKEKSIMDLQQALKNAQAKLRNQQQATAQLEEQRKKEEEMNLNNNQMQLCTQDENKIAELEKEICNLENFLKGALEICGLPTEECSIEDRCLYLEQNCVKLENYLKDQQRSTICPSLKDLCLEVMKRSKQHASGAWNIQELKKDLDLKNNRINELEFEMSILDQALIDSSNAAVLDELKMELKEKDTQIRELENQLRALTNNDCLQDIEETLNSLRKEIFDKDNSIKQLSDKLDEKYTSDHGAGSLDELEGLLDLVRERDERILELEDALRESVSIATERERVLENEERKRRNILEKVSKLEQRLLSLQSAHAMRCVTCKPLLKRLQMLEQRLQALLAERRGQLQDLAHMKQEALEAAISEKDAHLALLEVSGVRTASQAERAECLRRDRTRLTERLKTESENSIALLQECSDLEMDLGLVLVYEEPNSPEPKVDANRMEE